MIEPIVCNCSPEIRGVPVRRHSCTCRNAPLEHLIGSFMNTRTACVTLLNVGQKLYYISYWYGTTLVPHAFFLYYDNYRVAYSADTDKLINKNMLSDLNNWPTRRGDTNTIKLRILITKIQIFYLFNYTGKTWTTLGFHAADMQ